MNISQTYKRRAVCIGVLLAVLLAIAGCADIQPINPPNHREEGPSKGLFTGSQGEWVIFGSKAPQAGGEEDKTGAPQSETDREKNKDPEKPTDDEQ